MAQDNERIIHIQTALRDAGLDALVCTLPANVLMLSGYWPVVGSALAVATRGGQVAILAPEDERDLATHGWATDLRTFEPGSLERLTSPAAAVRKPLGKLLRDLGVSTGSIGYEVDAAYEPASYAAMYLYGPAAKTALSAAAPDAKLVAATAVLRQLRASMTRDEVGRVRLACEIAKTAFTEGARWLRPGFSEAEAATAFQAMRGLEHVGIERAGGFTYCMSGPNEALAGGAYARTRARELQKGDLVLVHCNSYIDGYWTDITRTYFVGEPDERRRAMDAAVSEARAAALAAIRPGVRAADVDRAARGVLVDRGFGEQFTHGLGQNVGFSAISAEFPPRLHPASDDRLEIGMTFNVEPAIYITGYGGMRHCDVVTLTADGAEVLTPFQASMDALVVGG
jgi:Xaa-Pro dipeptidase